MTGWKRLVGQEVPVDAYTNIMGMASTPNAPAAVANLTDVNGAAVTSSYVNSTDTARRFSQIVNGPQTPKATQPALNMWIPLIFWFNKDPRLSIASVSIPYGKLLP